MKSKIFTVLFLFTIVIGNTQVQIVETKKSSGLWIGPEHDTDEVCVPPEEHKRIKARIKKSVKNMRKAGILEKHFSSSSRMAHPLFEWPMRQADGFNDPGYYTLSNYVDLDPDTTVVLDYNGLSQSYEGHSGIDIRLDPYKWEKMNDSHVEAIAAADGVIIFKQDGNSDTSCECDFDDPPPWNAVYIMHADGSITWYGHLKTNTTTAKDSGDLVNVGEYLGVIGSSGSSSTPHLHFEVYDNLDSLIEPFFGPSNNTTADSWWADQLPYYDSGINKIATNSTFADIPDCPGIEIPNEKSDFYQGDSIFFSIAIRHSLTSDSAVVELFLPNGDQSSFLDLTYIREGPPFFKKTHSYYWNGIIENSTAKGKWTYRVTYYSSSYAPQIVESNFWVKNDCITNLQHIVPLTQSRYYQASNIITSSSTISNDVHIVYDAGNFVALLPGFIAPVGSKLEVKLAGCN